MDSLAELHERNSTGPLKYGLHSNHGTPHRFDEVEDIYDNYAEARTPIPPTSTPGLQRRPTTKDLISRYEDISYHPEYVSQSASPPRSSKRIQYIGCFGPPHPRMLTVPALLAQDPQRPAARPLPIPEMLDLPTPIHPPKTPSEGAVLKEKTRGPLRTSIRNLLTALGVKGKSKTASPLAISYDDTPIITPYFLPSLTNTLATRPLPLPPTDTTLSTDPEPFNPAPGEHLFHSGPVLYLERQSRASLHLYPVWSPKKLSLYSTQLIVSAPDSISSLSRPNNPHSFAISLATCSNVHSANFDTLDVNERMLLPQLCGDAQHRVFELTFDDDRPKERFAVESRQERSVWVSSVWDVLLQRRDKLFTIPEALNSGTFGESPSQFPVDSTVYSTLNAVLVTDNDFPLKPLSRSQTLSPPSLSMSDQDSQTTTTTASPSRFPPPTSPPSLYTQDRGSHDHTERLASPEPQPSPRSPKRSPSPSILSLGQRSIVQARLSEIQGLPSPPPRSPPSSATPPRSYSVSPPLSPFAQRRAGLLLPNGDVIDSYATPTPSVKLPAVSRIPWQEETATQSNASMGGGSSIRPYRPLPSEASTSETGPSTASSRISSNATVSSGSSQHSSRAPTTVFSNTSASDQSTLHVVEYDQVKKDHDALLSFVKDASTRHDEDHVGLGVQLADMKKDVQGMSQELFEALQALGASIPSGIDGGLREVLRRLGEMTKILETQTLAQAAAAAAVQAQAIVPEDEIVTLRNVRAGSEDQQRDLATENATQQLTDVHAKLDELVIMVNDLAAMKQESERQAQTVQSLRIEPVDLGLQKTVEDLHHRLDADSEDRKIHQGKQADAMKSLDETKHRMGSLDSALQVLCKELGIPLHRNVSARAGQAAEDSTPLESTLLEGLRKIVHSDGQREMNEAALKGLLENVLAIVHANAGSSMSQEGFADYMNHYRHEQYNLLRTVAADLTEEIKGERLKFIDAMKSATAINVQQHVDEFKRQLGREVMSMTSEVDRLQRERQALEQQIAELFAFFAKQNLQPHPPQVGSSMVQHPPPPPQSQPQARSRPLPQPRRSSYNRPLAVPGGPAPRPT